MKLTIVNALASVVLAVALLAVFLLEDSVLAAAQAADSGADVLVAIGLLVAIFIGRQPADRSHHYGHGQAEPIAALVAAFIAAQLGIEVVRAAVGALRGAPLERLSLWVAAVFSAKIVFKAIVGFIAFGGRSRSAALDALAIDARNDVMVGLVAIAGYVSVNAGFGRVDAILALAVGIFVFASAIGLAVRSIALLMGAAPGSEQVGELKRIAGGVEGVLAIEEFRARISGNGIEVSLSIVVDKTLAVSDAHEIADEVERALEKDAEVLSAAVHVHPTRRGAHTSEQSE